MTEISVVADLQQYVIASFMLIGLVNGSNFALEKQWKSFAKFMLAIVAGAVFGYFKMFTLPSLEIGLAVGMASSGVYKGLQIFKGE